MLRLYGNAELASYIMAQARRHFSNAEDQEDARAEVWEQLCELKNPPLGDSAKRFAYRKIKNRYDRMLYRKREGDGS